MGNINTAPSDPPPLARTTLTITRHTDPAAAVASIPPMSPEAADRIVAILLGAGAVTRGRA